MKKIIIFSAILVLSACAKERTTQFYSTEGQTGDGKPSTFVLTNEDYDKQQLDKKIEPSVKPKTAPENLIVLKEDFDQESLAKLFASYTVEEVKLPTPEGVICEFIPQLRIQKTLGRLTCMKQTPDTSNEEALKNSAHYECSVDTTQSKKLSLSDKTLYENLNLSEVEDQHGYKGYRTFKKEVGPFHCEKMIKIDSGKVRYECAVYLIAK